MSESFGFLSDKPRREHFADEASFYTAQLHWLEMQRSAARYQPSPHSDASDESYKRYKEKLAEIQAKRAEKRAKNRQHAHDRYWRDPEHAREIARKSYRKHCTKRQAYGRARHVTNREYILAYQRQYNAVHSEHRRAYNQQWWQALVNDPFAHGYYKAKKRIYRARRYATDPVYVRKNRKYKREYMKNKRTSDPVFLEKQNARRRELRASDPAYRETCNSRSRERYRLRMQDAQYREHKNQRERERRAANPEDYRAKERERNARRHAKKLDQQQRDENAA